MKEKLRKHRFSVLFALIWGALGIFLLWTIGVNFFPFIEDGQFREDAWPLMVGAIIGYVVIALILARIRVHPFAKSPFIVNFVGSVVTAFLFMGLAAARVYFSLGYLLVYLVFVNLWFFLEFGMRSRLGAAYKLAWLTRGYDLSGLDLGNCKILPFSSPEDFPDDVDGLVVDFGEPLSEEWISFISRCVLEGVPVVSADEVVEAQRGFIILEHMTTARSVTFQSLSVYIPLKRIIDIAFVILTLPLAVPIALVAALAIRIESRGPVIYSQMRVGRGGAPFRVYKLRSMRPDSEANGAAFASTGDSRITRVGAFIRKYRIDELPQFINIIIGNMSLIGPRPEQIPFVERFNETIPYYRLRHIVRPGITGWAQVNQGYAAGETETAEKLSNDLYYVKHISLPLDLLIISKTIGTVLSGFGAR